jgi:hypothetical protein
MTGRIGDRLRKLERAVRTRPLHLIVCEDGAEVAKARRFLGDRFGDLVFVATGVRRGCDEATRRAQWLSMAKKNLMLPSDLRRGFGYEIRLLKLPAVATRWRHGRVLRFNQTPTFA